MNNFQKRAITGILFVSVISGAIICNPVSFLAIFGFINFFCLEEFFRITRVDKTHILTGVFVGVINWLAISLFVLNKAGINFTYYSLFSLLLILAGKPKHLLKTFLGLCYITLPVYLLIILAFYNGSYQSSFILAMLISVWVNDTMAYVTGSLFGKHKFFEKVSPKKTWEGVFGGFIFALLFAFVNYFLFGKISLLNWLVLAVIASIFAISGDLIESVIKRKHNIKDSGSFFPGHGGFLDRFDALLFVIPFYFLYLIYFVF